jgi:hypothetical protein
MQCCQYQEFTHFFGTNAVTLTAKWEAAKQRAPEPPLLSHLCVARASIKMWCSLTQNTAINGVNCSLWSSLPLGLVRAIFTYKPPITSLTTLIYTHQTKLFGGTPVPIRETSETGGRAWRKKKRAQFGPALYYL